MRGQPSEFSIFVAHLARAAKGHISDYTVAVDARLLSSLSRKMDAIATRQCNGYKDDAQEKRDSRAWARAESQARTIARKYGFEISVQGDPRGYCLKLIAPPPSDPYAKAYTSAEYGVPL